MLTRLVHASLKYRVAVIAAAAVLTVLGVYVVRESPLDVFPEFAPPMVEVQTEAPGLSSTAVETQVTIPLEGVLNGVPGMTLLRSKSVQGLSSVQLLFAPGTDMTRARQMVDERVKARGVEGGNIRAPRLMPPLSSTSRIHKLGLTSRHVPPLLAKLRAGNLPPEEQEKIKQQIELHLTAVSETAEWVLVPRLEAVPGVANISIYGLREKEYHLLVRPDQLAANQVTLKQFQEKAADFVRVGSAGYLDSANQRRAVPFETAFDLENAVVDVRDGKSLRVRQVGAVARIGNPIAVGEGTVDDQPALLMVIEKAPEANTLQVTHDIEQALEELKPALPDDLVIASRIFRPATFIERALLNLRTAMIIGSILVALILVAFLFEWRTAVISLTAIPLSLLSAVVIISRLGGTLNTMVLAGLAIAVGEVVDDAIIDVENIVRRLRQNRGSAAPRSAFRVVLDASLEVRSAVVFASFIVVFVCLPIFFMEGVAGSFFRPLALAYILAVLASLVVALTVTPALALMLLPGKIEKRGETVLVRGIKGGYRRLLPALLNHPRAALGVLGLLFALAAASVVYPGFKQEYLPKFQETVFLMHWIAKPGTSIEAVREDIAQLSRELREAKAVQECGSHIGRAAEHGEEVVGTNFAEVWVSLGDDVTDYAAARKKIESITVRHVWVNHDLLTYLQERIKEVLTGASASIVIRIYGDSTDRLREKAAQVKQALDKIPGVSDARAVAQDLVPEVKIALDPKRLSDYGLNAGDVDRALGTLMVGTRVGRVQEGQRSFHLVVIGHPDIRQTKLDLEKLEIDMPGAPGKTVPLGRAARVFEDHAPNTIRHISRSRCIDVTCNAKGRDLGSVARDVEDKVRPLTEEGYRIEFLGEYAARTADALRLLGIGALAVLGVAILLYLDFQSARLTLMVMLTLPFALIGGVGAAWLTGGELTLGSLVGFITVLGIAARNGIMLVSHYRHLQAEEGMPFGRALILRGAEERVSPILMTALAAGLGLLPLALSGNKPGYEVEYPMAVVILGGLFTSTVLNLFLLPVLYERLGRSALPADEEKAVKIAESKDAVPLVPKLQFGNES